MEIQDFFREHRKVALAFSGGVDSSYLFYACARYAEDFRAYYVRSQFQPEFEWEDARRVAEYVAQANGRQTEPFLRERMKVLPVDIVSLETVAENPADRCYYCKQQIMGTVMKQAVADGFTELIDGTNASDDAGDRPGMRALRELKVLSPLRLCGITKAQVRILSREACLPTWDKPAYACLATRIPAGERITAEKLERIERSEKVLFSLGFTDFRVRMRGEDALLQVTEEQMVPAQGQMNAIRRRLEEDFRQVQLDPVPRAKSR